jgi:hypothetical protein
MMIKIPSINLVLTHTGKGIIDPSRKNGLETVEKDLTMFTAQGQDTGLPDFSWGKIPKPEKWS